MIKILAIALALALAVACASPPVQRSAESFIVIGTVVNQAANSITVSIRAEPPATKEHNKTVAEQAISRYRDQYRSVIINSYVGGDSPSELPFATSIFENGATTHQFNPRATTQKIPTH